jgi:hypothetical protein
MAVPWNPRDLTDQELILLIDHLQRVLHTRVTDTSATAAIPANSPSEAAAPVPPRKRRHGARSRTNPTPNDMQRGIPKLREKEAKTTACSGGRHMSSPLPDIVPIAETSTKTEGMADSLNYRLAVPDLWPRTTPKPASREHRRVRPETNRKFRLNVFQSASSEDTKMECSEFRDIGRLLHACARSLEKDDFHSNKSAVQWPGVVLLEALVARSRWGFLTAGVCLLCWAMTTQPTK